MLYLACGLAIIVALIALCEAGAVARRVDERYSAFVESHVAPLRRELEGWRRDTDGLSAHIGDVDAKIDARLKDIVARLERAEALVAASCNGAPSRPMVAVGADAQDGQVNPARRRA